MQSPTVFAAWAAVALCATTALICAPASPSPPSARPAGATYVSLAAAQRPLVEQLARLSGTMGTKHETDGESGERNLFVFAREVPAEELRTEIAALFTQDDRVYASQRTGGAARRGATANRHEAPTPHFFLEGRARTEAETVAQRVKAQMDHARNVRRMAAMSEQEREAAATDDPHTASLLRSERMRARVQLSGAFTDADMERVIRTGDRIDVSMRNLPLQWRTVAEQAGRNSYTTETNPQGQVRPIFDGTRFADEGHLRLYMQPIDGRPILCLGLYMGEKGARVGMQLVPLGGPLRHRDNMEREAQSVARRRLEHARRLTPNSATDTVTIRRDAEVAEGEDPLAAYLGEFSRQTGLSVLATWPRDQKTFQKRLPESIRKQPLGEALNLLAKAYDCEWDADKEGRVVRFRPVEASPGP